MDYKARLGKNIRKIRNKLDWTIDDLAEETGLSSNFVGNIERGQGVASVRTLIKLMEALGCNADEIFAGIIGEKYECSSQNTVYIRNVLNEMSVLNEEQQKSLYQIFKIYMDDFERNKN